MDRCKPLVDDAEEGEWEVAPGEDDDGDTFAAFGGGSGGGGGGDAFEAFGGGNADTSAAFGGGGGEGSGGGGGGGTFLALVPWADALNHDADAGGGAVLTYHPARGVAELRAASGAAPGSEVFDSYGQGLTLIHFSAQPELFPTQNISCIPPNPL